MWGNIISKGKFLEIFGDLEIVANNKFLQVVRLWSQARVVGVNEYI